MVAIQKLLSIVALASAAPGFALADPGAGPAPTGSAAALSLTVDPGIREDPNGDRGFLLPTALTQPARTLTITDYDIFVLGATYGITDRLQVGVTAMLAGGLFLPQEAAIASLKWQLLRAGHLRLAVLGGVTYSKDEDHDTLPASYTTRVAPQATMAASYCLSDDCHSLLTANLQALLPVGLGHQDPNILYSAGGTFRLSPRWKLLVEAQQSFKLADDTGGPSSPLVCAGFRAFGRRLAGEAGVMTLFSNMGSPFPILYLSATFRL